MQGFKAISVKFSERSQCSRVIYMKAHSVREKIPEKPTDKTLFLVGIPAYYSENTLKLLFQPYGTVTAVYFHKTPTTKAPAIENSKFFPENHPVLGFKVAYIVFAKPKDLKNVLEIEDVLVLPKNSTVTGVKKWAEEYNKQIPEINALNMEIKEFMDTFDQEVAKKVELDKQLREGDEDGWVTVTKGGKRPGFARKESVRNRLQKKYEKQKQKTELKDFYTFQIKESKMKNLIALRKKFEEDKKKISALKQSRRFKPF